MKIGDEVYVRGYIDEIRQDTVIIRNDGGYFGTVPSEVVEQEPKRGKWIMHPEGKFVGFPYVHYECSECRAFVPEDTEYCSRCGARMESDNE